MSWLSFDFMVPLHRIPIVPLVNIYFEYVVSVYFLGHSSYSFVVLGPPGDQIRAVAKKKGFPFLREMNRHPAQQSNGRPLFSILLYP